MLILSYLLPPLHHIQFGKHHEVNQPAILSNKKHEKSWPVVVDHNFDLAELEPFQVTTNLLFYGLQLHWNKKCQRSQVFFMFFKLATLLYFDGFQSYVIKEISFSFCCISLSGNEFKDSNKWFRQCTFLCITLNVGKFSWKCPIPSTRYSSFRSEIHGSKIIFCSGRIYQIKIIE